MGTYLDNPIMEWWDTRIYTGHAAASWVKITDHNRSPLSVSNERIENKQRMVDGTLRRHVVAKKRTWSCSWENVPSKSVPLLAGGQSGDWMEQFHLDTDGSFVMRIRAGSEIHTTLPTTLAGTLRTGEFRVMIADFSKEVLKRGPNTDLISMDLTLEEV